MAYTREELKARYSSPAMQKALTIGYEGVPADDLMLRAFTQAADESGLDVKKANEFLARFMEAAAALKGGK